MRRNVAAHRRIHNLFDDKGEFPVMLSCLEDLCSGKEPSQAWLSRDFRAGFAPRMRMLVGVRWLASIEA